MPPLPIRIHRAQKKSNLKELTTQHGVGRSNFKIGHKKALYQRAKPKANFEI